NNYLDIEFGHPDRTLTSQRVSLANCASSAHPPQVADFDGDGIPDIIVAEAPCQGGASEMLDFLKGNGNGTFQSEQVIYTTNDLIPEWFVMKASASGKPGLAVYQYQDVNRTVTNPEELIMVNTTP
ncbi:MAG TPA: VCBS repeat-containing protein, partial [Terracidiphilus sp.]|nr:VCBS repeat-containing protein [Terracidiphilus sp.]